MGINLSTPCLQRKKSFSTFGRSSQRSLFHKTKARLKSIENKLKNEASHDEIRNELEIAEKELMSVSDTVKDKNKEKYEDVLMLFVELKNRVPEKPAEIEVTNIEDVNNVEEDAVELRKPIELYKRPESPSIKFGVQVMPSVLRVSQEMLKRSTVPQNEAAKVEFQEIRSKSSDVNVYSSLTTKVRENGYTQEFTRVSIEKRPFQVKSDLNEVDKVRKIVDELEIALKYFHGTKDDEEYRNLHQKLIQNFAKLDNIESEDNPVIKQEKKILIQRIQELLKILERISEPVTAIIVESLEEENHENSVGTAI